MVRHRRSAETLEQMAMRMEAMATQQAALEAHVVKISSEKEHLLQQASCAKDLLRWMTAVWLLMSSDRFARSQTRVQKLEHRLYTPARVSAASCAVACKQPSWLQELRPSFTVFASL